MVEQFIYDDVLCAHCQKNPNATKPYVKLKRIYLDDKLMEMLEKAGELVGAKPDCVGCQAMHEKLLEWKKKYGE